MYVSDRSTWARILQADRERFEQALGAKRWSRGLVVDAVIAKSEVERRAMWAPREDVFQTERYGPTHNFDVSLAIADMPRYLDDVAARAARAACRARA